LCSRHGVLRLGQSGRRDALRASQQTSAGDILPMLLLWAAMLRAHPGSSDSR
jgi:hypothetical protein